MVSSPRVVTGDNQKAHIEQGTEIPYVTPGSANSPATVSFKKAVLRLDVTPQITPDNRIIMTVEIRKDSVGQYVQQGGGFQVPSIDTKNVTTQIAVNNGDTAVIGGIFEETIRNDVDKVPFLGDLPFLGYLFKTTGKSNEKTELLIFLTPRVVKDTVTLASGSARPGARRLVRVSRLSLQCPGAAASGQSISGGPARRGQVDARPPARAPARASASSTPTTSSSAASASRSRRSSKSRARPDSATARRPCIAELTAREDIVLATGGGAVLRAANRERLRANGTVRLPPCRAGDADGSASRRSKHRPLLQTCRPAGAARELYAQRDPLYREVADLRRRLGSRRASPASIAPARGGAARRPRRP